MDSARELSWASPTAFDVVADKIRRALPEIRATLDHHMNSARAEANNTTVRMLTRRGFGNHC